MGTETPADILNCHTILLVITTMPDCPVSAQMSDFQDMLYVCSNKCKEQTCSVFNTNYHRLKANNDSRIIL